MIYNLLNKISSLLFFLILLTGPLSGQITKIRGKVSDAKTSEPLAFVNIAFKGTNIGCITDFNGEYFLETRSPSDSLVASFVGYEPLLKKVKKHTFQEIDFELSPSDVQLEEVVVHAGENPAHILLRKLIGKKAENNPDKYESYQYENYSKLEFDVTNIDEDFKSNRVFNHFQFIFDYVDTSAQTGKSYLPVFINETLSNYYYQKSPRKEKEEIRANKMSGIQNESITQFTGQMYQQVNFYENYVDVFGKKFVSPLSKFGLLTYKYYLVDSAFKDNQWCYLMTYKPRRKQEYTFTGEFWVHDSTFAVKSIRARKNEDVNINYIDDLVVDIEYQQIDEENWFLKREDIFVEFNLSEKSTGVFGRKITSYRDVKINPQFAETFFNPTMPQETVLIGDPLKADTSIWNQARHENLTQKEQNIYAMVDSIKEVPIFNTYVDIVTMLVDGYYNMGKFDYGPYFKTFSFNPIEGYRFRIGGQTSTKFSEKMQYRGHIAYGTKDERFKYGVGGMYLINKNPRVSAGISHKYDIEQLGQSINAFTEDNILSSILSRNPNDNLLLVQEFKGYYEKEWFQGFSNTLHVMHRQIFPSEKIIFENDAGESQNDITSFEVTLNTRFSLNEKFVYGVFDRVSLGTKYPIISTNVTYGMKDVLGSDYEFVKLHVSISHHFDINSIGYFRYILEGGRIWGQVPFPLLRLHEGNETYTRDPYAFNLMNYYEFASDKYLSLFAEHKFQGRFLNKIPLMRKLKWREVVHGRALIGGIDKENESKLISFPETLSSVNKPYVEAGVGIENIFKVFRLDAIWRFSYLDHENIETFGLRAGVQIIF